MGQSKVSVIVLAWPPNQDRRRNVMTLLESLGRVADPASLEVVVVCNGDDESLASRLRQHSRVDHTLAPGTNLGVAPGWNLALGASSGDAVFLVNEDAIFGERTVEQLLAALDDESTGLVAPAVGSWSRRTLFPVRRPRAEPEEFFVPAGYLLAMRRAVCERVGGFEERLAPLFFEEIDLALRLEASGYRIRAAKDCGVLHEWGISRSDRSRVIDWSGGRESVGRIHRRNHRFMLEALERSALACLSRPASVRLPCGDGPGQAGADPLMRRLVAHLIQLDGPGGGPASVVEQLAGLRDGYEQVVYHGGSGKIAAACEAAGIDHVRLPIERAWQWPRGFFGFVRDLRRRRPDVLLLHGQWSSGPGALAARAAGLRRLIYVARWPAFYTDWDLLRTIRNRLAEGIPCRLSNRIVTLTASSARQYVERGCVDPDRLVTIPNSIDLSIVPGPERRLALRERDGWDPSLCHVVSAGRLADQKRVDWLLRSWAVVRREVPEARLWIAGDGPERTKLERLARDLKLSGSCTFLGERADALELVAAADIAVMTSTYEGFSRSALEALACGRALVASDVDGLGDLFTDGTEGFLVPAGDVGLFSARIEQLIRDPSLRRKMGDAGVRRAADFSSEAVAPRLRRLVEGVLDEGVSRDSS